jgi:hypothetical protein
LLFHCIIKKCVLSFHCIIKTCVLSFHCIIKTCVLSQHMYPYGNNSPSVQLTFIYLLYKNLYIISTKTQFWSLQSSYQQGWRRTPWVIVVLCQFSNLSYMSWREQVNCQWDDDEFRFVLDQHAELDVYSASTSSLKQQFADRHVAPLSHIILIL